MMKDVHYHHILAIDTETEGFDPHTCALIYLQIGTGENEYVIDVASVDISPLKELLESRTLIMHNAKFDLRFLFKQGFNCTRVFDTFLAESVLTTGMDKPAGYRGLDGCLRRYCKVQLQKEIRGLIHKERYSTRVIQYSAADVQYLHKLKESQELALDNNDLSSCASLENKFVVALAYIEYCGIHLDTTAWSVKMQEDKRKQAMKAEELSNWVIENYPSSKFIDNQLSLFEEGTKCSINWNSDKQVLELFKLIGIDTWDAKAGKHSVDMKLISKQVDKFEILKTYIEYSKTTKLVSSFGQTILDSVNKNTNRIHTTFRQIKDTGRMSCGNRRTNSPNLQQIPSDDRHRSCFTAEPGNKIIVCDYASQESRILADISNEPNLVKFYTSGGADLHSYAAQVVYEELATVTLEDIKKFHKDKRQVMKGFNFALAYGGTGETVSRNLNIPIDIAKRAEEDYFKAFSGLKNYFEIAKKKPLSTGYVLIDPVSKRKSFIDFYDDFLALQEKIDTPGFWDDYRQNKSFETEEYLEYYKPTVREYFKMKGIIERKGLNYVIQGTAASQTKYAGIKLFKWIMDNNYFGVVKIVNLVHDEIVVECPEEIVDDVKPKVKQFMEEGANKFMRRIPMIADPEISNHWKK
jgi:DNA polymerase I-like protein with 3'-5' exonuclease and polymerase domains|tara:strand:+ start:732 stop:2639 length:1908 start_codon:yes stop_codon:yes gene_type:complete